MVPVKWVLVLAPHVLATQPRASPSGSLSLILHQECTSQLIIRQRYLNVYHGGFHPVLKLLLSLFSSGNLTQKHSR